MSLTITLFPGSVAPNPGDVANGYYPGIQKIGLDDPNFIKVIEWLQQRIGFKEVKVIVPQAQTITGPGKPLPTNLVFCGVNGFESDQHDAAQVFNFPHIVLTELKNTFNVGDPRVTEFYPGPLFAANTQPAGEPDSLTPWTPDMFESSPVGEPFAVMGEGYFFPVIGDKSPLGSTYAVGNVTFTKVNSTGGLRHHTSWHAGAGA
jgi:hypothetical protein